VETLEQSSNVSENKEIKTVIYGVGEIGSQIIKCLLKKNGICIVGAIDKSPDKTGKDLGELINLERKTGIIISSDPEEVLSQTQPDIVIVTTSSFLKDVYSQVLMAIKYGANVISTAEELAYPHIVDRKLADKLDNAAKRKGVTVLGTGINPGFLMDTLVITLSAVCQEIKRIKVCRVMNAAVRRIPFQKKIGAGLTVEEFTKKMEKRVITGHVGLAQSVAMIADALGLKLEKVEVEPVKPIVAEKTVESPAIKVKPGCVAGLMQRAHGIINGEHMITLEFQAYIGAEKEYDSITIEGTPHVHEVITPCIHGDLGTVAVIVNMIPKVIKASPGLKTMKDMLLPSAALGDMRKYLQN